MSSSRPRLTAFSTLVAARFSRRGFLAAAGQATAAAGLGALATTAGAYAGARGALPRVAPSRSDALELAAGYRFDVIARWGDALWPGERGLDDATLRRGGLVEAGEPEAQARRFGSHCDAIAFFALDGREGRRGLLCVNHEFVIPELAFSGLSPRADERLRARRA